MLDAPSNITDDITLRREAWRWGFVIKSSRGQALTVGRVCYHPAHPGLGSHAGSWPPKEGEVMPFVDLFRMLPEGNGAKYTLETVRSPARTARLVKPSLCMPRHSKMASRAPWPSVQGCSPLMPCKHCASCPH